MKIELRKPGVGFILLACSLVFTIVGFILYQSTFNVFSYQPSKQVIIYTIITIWGLLYLLINGLISGNKPYIGNIFYLINCFSLLLAFSYLLIPCLSQIAVFFTVNMGDMETYALGVPRCIAGCVFFALAMIFNVISSFFNITKKEVKANE